MTAPRITKSIGRSPSRLALLLILLVFVCFALSPSTQAVVPAPDGGYPGFTTAEGTKALQSLTTGSANTAVGWYSLFTNTQGSFNTATGAGALLSNTADENTAFGAAALLLSSTGSYNTAVGALTLLNNTGQFNTATGDSALYTNTDGNFNAATGWAALYGNTFGSGNTAMGFNALGNNTTGGNNVALGFFTGNGVVMASNVVCIGANVLGADVDNTTWIGNVYDTATQDAQTAPVIVSAEGQLGTVVSSERFKKDIATMEKASEVILSLRPVTFHYKSDVKDFPQFGLIAEEVAKVNPALVLRDKEGKPYTVRYDAINAMLLNEFLKEHRKNEEQAKTIVELKSGMIALAATVKEQASQIQKVSAQLELNKPAPKTVKNTD